MYAEISRISYLIKHRSFPFFKCPLIYLFTGVLDLVTQSGMLIRKQMMLLDIRPEFVAYSKGSQSMNKTESLNLIITKTKSVYVLT